MLYLLSPRFPVNRINKFYHIFLIIHANVKLKFDFSSILRYNNKYYIMGGFYMTKKLLGSKTRRYLDEKVSISMRQYASAFEVTLRISKGVPKGTQLSMISENVEINLLTLQDISKEVFITRLISYKKDADGDIKPKKLKIRYNKTSFIKGFLSLPPELYLTRGMLKHAQTTQEMKKDFPIEIHAKRPHPSGSKFTPYTVAKPHDTYRG